MSDRLAEARGPAPSVDPLPSAWGKDAGLVFVGMLVTNLAQEKNLGRLSIMKALVDGQHLARQDVSFFLFLATFAWKLKPLAGVLVDAYPLLGTRRRHYLVLGAATAAAFWLVAVGTIGSYGAFLATSILLNAALVLASTTVGALLVEAGRVWGAHGRFASLVKTADAVASIGGPLASGYLATRAFGLTAGVAACLLCGVAVLGWVLLRDRVEPSSPPRLVDVRPAYRPPGGLLAAAGVLGLIAAALVSRPELRQTGVSAAALPAMLLLFVGLATVPTRNRAVVDTQDQVRRLLESRAVWLTTVLLVLVYVEPSLGTALYYRQHVDLGFTAERIGELGSIQGSMAFVAAVLYAAISRHVPLRPLLAAGIVLGSVASLLFLAYSPDTASAIHASAGFGETIAALALTHLAMRATPAGCEALGFAFLMSALNVARSLSDVVGSQMMDSYHLDFDTMVWISGSTSLATVLFLQLLPARLVGGWTRG